LEWQRNLTVVVTSDSRWGTDFLVAKWNGRRGCPCPDWRHRNALALDGSGNLYDGGNIFPGGGMGGLQATTSEGEGECGAPWVQECRTVKRAGGGWASGNLCVGANFPTTADGESSLTYMAKWTGALGRLSSGMNGSLSSFT